MQNSVTRSVFRTLPMLVGASVFLAQDPPHRISVDVQTVSVDVEVFDSSGRPVTGLERDDFQIYEDGKLQEIRNFSSADAPYNLVLLFDCSDSMKAHWPMIDDAMARFTRHQRPQDRVLLAAFASQVRVIQDWGSPRDVQFDRDPRLCRATRYYAALNWAEDALRSMKTRRGIVILTDGVDSSPDATETQDFSKALNRFRGVGIPLYFVAVGTDLNPTPGVPGHAPAVRLRMEQLAEVSGGNVVFPKTPEEVIPLYEQIARELGTSYSLGYAPPNTTPDGKRHRIEVRLRAGKLQVRQSRTEYIWE